MPQEQKNNLIDQPEMIFSVGEYIEAVNLIVKRFRVKITGEVTGVKHYPSGHCYFTLKDSSPESQTSPKVLECIVWKYDYQICGLRLEEGMEVILGGAGQVYEASGRFSFVAKTVELKGEGALKKAYEQLKAKLEAEGVFAPERKRPLPDFPKNIGVVTSKQGAVIHDFLNNLGQFGFTIKMVDSRVEGQEAVGDLLAAIKAFKEKEIDVLVIIRGGGSLESLQAFNNEALVRAIVGFKAPVIAAIGHDKDVPLLALAADYMCSTPTAAANTLNETWKAAPLAISQRERFIFERFGQAVFSANNVLWRNFNAATNGLASVLRQYRQLADKPGLYLAKISGAIGNNKIKTANYGKILLAKLENQLKTVVQQLFFMAKTAQAHNPEKNLALGYCLARKNNKVIKNAGDFNAGDDFDLQMQGGIVNSKVKNIWKHKTA